MSEDDGAPSESHSFGSANPIDELLHGLQALGPRDISILSVLVSKVRAVEAEQGEEAACALIDAVIALLEANRPRS